MIHIIDTIVLAHTKIRTRKIRTAITVTISGLLFGLLLCFIFVTSGISQSVDKFGDTGLGQRYILLVMNRGSFGSDEYDLLTNASVINRVEELRANRIQEKTEAAKELHIDYSPQIDDPLFITNDPDTHKKMIDFQYINSPDVRTAIDEYQNKDKKPFDIKATTKGYDVAGFPSLRAVMPQNGQLDVMEDGKEAAFSELTGHKVPSHQDDYQQVDTSLRILDASITRPFITSSFDPLSGSIPIIMPYKQVEKRLGLAPLKTDASKKQRFDRINEVHNRAHEVTIDMCYRNTASQELLATAIRQQQEIKRNTGKDDFVAPPVTYNLPDEKSCGAVTVANDTRSFEEKEQADNQDTFDRKFNNKIDPEEHKVRLQVVGVAPAGPNYQASSFTESIISMFTPTIGETWTIPEDLFNQLPKTYRPNSIFAQRDSTNEIAGMFGTSLVEFSTLSSAKNYMRSHECIDKCNDDIIATMPFGSSTLITASFKDFIKQIMYWVVLAFTLVAVIILTGMIGRTIADSRRETAVFRAIGARRSDISAIYTLYTLLLASRIVISACLLGGILAIALDLWLSPNATYTALVAFGATDAKLQFHFFGLDVGYIALTIVAIILAAFVAMLLPLFRNVRRNPINDMRDE